MGHRASSTDLGDVSHLLPSIHPYMNGGSGTHHSKDWHISDKEMEYEEVLDLHRAWPTSKLLSTDGLGHRRILKDAAVIEEVTRFMTSGEAAERLAAPSE